MMPLAQGRLQGPPSDAIQATWTSGSQWVPEGLVAWGSGALKVASRGSSETSTSPSEPRALEQMFMLRADRDTQGLVQPFGDQ